MKIIGFYSDYRRPLKVALQQITAFRKIAVLNAAQRWQLVTAVWLVKNAGLEGLLTPSELSLKP